MLFALLVVVDPIASAQERSKLADALEQIRSANQVPALGALLYQDGAIRDVAAVGVRIWGESTRVKVTDQFHLGSDTKAMTATLVALMIDRGLLTWTSTLAELLPDITTMDPAYRSVTVEMLLAHRAGLGSEFEFDHGQLMWQLQSSDTDPAEGRRMLARAMLSIPPQFEPGSIYHYSNAGYVIAGRILERVTGKAWEFLIREELFKPLKMESCGFGPLGYPNQSPPQQPWAHERTATGLHATIIDNPETLGPAATVHCSMQDWMKFIALHIDAYNGKPRIVSAEGFRKLHTAYPGQDYTYGGWIRAERPWAAGAVFTHDGSNTLNYATVWWAPSRNLAAMAVTNVGGEAGMKAAQEAVNTALREAIAQ